MSEIIIKKYPNRRLYNTSTSSYINQQDLLAMLKSGQDFIVLDVKTNQNLTKSILIQIIFDQEQKGYDLLPLDFLKYIISLYDNNLGSFLPTYLEKTMEIFKSFSPEMENNNSPLKLIEEMTKQNLNYFESALSFFYKNKKSEE